ncbi:TonB-dependent receptor [Sphingobium sp.]|uniref:TonB-dependent receptor n=1 Tax=Sphingobium sp. TaxID=1912891 RepID=UPI0028BE807D|nr:TonB-dependent receptor [Sphingobium sp.]
MLARKCRGAFKQGLLFGCAAAGLVVQTAGAQTAGDAGSAGAEGAVPDIVVTAQKRSDRLRDVPISISAATGDQLAKLGVASADDLQKVVPGFTFKPARTGVPIYTIRGIGFDDFGVGSSPAVSVSVDQVPLPFLIMSPAASLDVERVEVLKGPQGTLFGQNTTGGAINFVAAKPTADPHMGFEVSYGRFNQTDASAYVSGPLSHNLRARLAVKHEYRDAWQVSETRPGDRLGRRDFLAGRLLLDWTPTERLSFELNANGWIDRSESQAGQFVTYAPGNLPADPNIFALIGNRPTAGENPRLADWNPDQNYRRNARQYQFSLRADWELNDQVTLTSLTSYAHLKSDTPADLDGTQYLLFRSDQLGRIDSVYQELRAAIDLDGLRFVVGGNYQDDHTDDVFGINFESSNNQIGPFVWNQFSETADQKVKTYAVFANADVPLTSTLTAQAGIRYTKQNRNFTGCLLDGGDGNLANAIALIPTLAGLPYDPAPPGGCVTLDATLQRQSAVTDKLDEDNVSWRLGLNWKPLPDTLVYASVTRGYKAGGYSPVPAVFAGQFAPVTQEQVTSYEAGVKAALLNRKVDFAAAVFYSDYRDKQLLGTKVFDPFGPLPTLVNVPKARVQGGELELTIRPLRGFTVAGGITYIDTQVTGSFMVPDGYGPTSPMPFIDAKGYSFPNTPPWQGNANVEYEFALSSGLTASLGSDVLYRSAGRADFSTNGVFRTRPYALLGLRAGIAAADGRWRFQLWGRNITNKFYETSIYKLNDYVLRTAGMPVTYGATLSAKF